MTTQFRSPEEAKGFFFSRCKFPLSEKDLREDSDLKVAGMEAMLLEMDTVPQEEKDQIQAKLDAQKGYVFDTPMGTFGIVIGPFRNGYELWLINMETGMANRL